MADTNACFTSSGERESNAFSLPFSPQDGYLHGLKLFCVSIALALSGSRALALMSRVVPEFRQIYSYGCLASIDLSRTRFERFVVCCFFPVKVRE